MIAALKRPLMFSKSFYDWLREGLAYGLPAKAADLFYRSTHHLHILDDGHAIIRTYRVKQSLLGKIRLDIDNDVSQAADVQLCLSPDHYYRLRLTLAASANGRLASAVSLKLNEASPIPLNAISYDFKKVGIDAKGRLLVDVVLCRNKTIDAVINYGHQKSNDVSIVACPNGETNDPYILHRKRLRRFDFSNSTAGVTAIAVSALILPATGVQTYLDKQTTAYEEYERGLILSLKVERTRLETLGEQVGAVQGRHAFYTPQEITRNLHRTFQGLPNGFVVTDISVEHHVLIISGLSLIEARPQIQERFDASHFVRSDRPGFEHVRLTIMMEGAS
ncbi:MAG: hypothetical protein AAGJ73_14575 [Pseudomonadota bacterium]